MREQGVRPRCAICWVDPVTGLTGTNETTRVCKKCKTDAANADWSTSPSDLSTRERARESASIDHAIREAVRSVIREEVRMAVREEIGRAIASLAPKPADAYLTVANAAAYLGVHPATIRAWLRAGRLRGHNAGRHLRVKRSDLDAHASSVPNSDVDIDARAAELAAV